MDEDGPAPEVLHKPYRELYEKEKLRNERMRVVEGIRRQIVSVLDLQELLRQVTGIVREAFGCYGVKIGLAEDDYIVFPPGFRDEHPEHEELRLKIGKEGLTGWVAAQKTSLYVPDVRVDSRYYRWGVMPDTLSELLVPILWQDDLLGVMDIASDRVDGFGEGDIAAMEQVAVDLAIAIKNARIFAETERHAIQLSTAADVSHAASSTLELNELLNMTVELIRERFNFYHVSIFLLDETNEWAVVRASSGEVGRRMLEAKHSLEVGGKSIVGTVTGTGRPHIALDVGEDATHFNNPLLPGTRSEMALPLRVRGEVIGALDVQSEVRAAFDEDDVAVLQTVADQLANAIKNAHLFTETEKRANQMAALYRTVQQLTSRQQLDVVLDIIAREAAWLVGAERGAIFLWDEETGMLFVRGSYRFGKAEDDPDALSPVYPGEGIVGRIAAYKQPLAVDDYEDFPERLEKQVILGAVAGVPVMLETNLLGVLIVTSRERTRPFDNDDLYTLILFAGQAAIAIENASLMERQIEEAQISSALLEVAQAIGEVLELHHLLPIIVGKTCRVFRSSHCAIELWRREEGRLMPEESYSLPPGIDILGKEEPHRMDCSFYEELERSGRPRVIEDEKSCPDDLLPTMLNWNLSSMIIAPVMSRGRLIGVLMAGYGRAHTFRQQEISIAQGVASQVAVAIEKARAYEQEQRLRMQLEALDNAALDITSELNLNMVLQRIVELARKLGEARYAAFVMSDEMGKGEHFLTDGMPFGIEDEEGRFPRLGELVKMMLRPDAATVRLRDVSRGGQPVGVLPDGTQVTNFLGIPVSIKEKVVGAIFLTEKVGRPEFSESDQWLIEMLAAHAALAIQNSRLIAAREEEAHFSTALLEVARAIGRFLSMDEILQVVTMMMPKLLGASRCVVFLWDKKEHTFQPRRMEGFSMDEQELLLGQDFGPEGLPALWHLIGEVNEPVIIEDARTSNLLPRYLAERLDIKPMLVLPLFSRGRTIGSIALARGSGSKPFIQRDLALARGIANQVAVSIENALLHQRLEEDLARKTTLYREMHHRIKNNLQAVAGFLSFQLTHTDRLSTGEVINGTLSRLKGIAVVHEALSAWEEETTQLEELARRAVEATRASYGGQKAAGVVFEGGGLTVHVDKAILLAQVVNELVMNALQHGNLTTESDIVVQIDSRDRVGLIRVIDSGDGIGDDFELDRDSGLGLTIVRALVERDLEGEFSLRRHSQRGTVATVTLPLANIERSDEDY